MIIQNCELFYPRLDPKKPNNKYNKDNPTWEIQIRTKDKKVKADWVAKNLRVKTNDSDDGVFYSVTLRKKSKKADGTPNEPVKVVNGSLDAVDPMTIGNGSVGNIRVFQYEYGEEKKIASMLMSIQITKHVEYIPKPAEDEFQMTETEVVKVGDLNGSDDPF